MILHFIALPRSIDFFTGVKHQHCECRCLINPNINIVRVGGKLQHWRPGCIYIYKRFMFNLIQALCENLVPYEDMLRIGNPLVSCFTKCFLISPSKHEQRSTFVQFPVLAQHQWKHMMTKQCFHDNLRAQSFGACHNLDHILVLWAIHDAM